MIGSPQPGIGAACEAARLRASLALDDALDDDFGLLLLERHLMRCPECTAVVAGMCAGTSAVRRAPALPFRCELSLPARRDVRRLPLANMAVAIATLAVAGVTLPNASPPSRPDDPVRLAAPPPRLPIGQRSAGEDFLARGRVDGVTTPVRS